ncbi:hypothetical protein [Candidatus Enterococcus ferrettii]|uniref:Uncharacterized protein n=1 Tax=Candidatus Enterococcus ferrettii TaxID=2815324 RepID=A0ABV0ERA9_9ENTE|nr:hypothetical protein [Enterococcus sp. 665A]MBO1342099.1 hypothetical protein [Enterococcus sp. 665A]
MKAKKKKQLKAQFLKESPLFHLKKETKTLIKKGENPYFLALDCLYHRYHITHFDKSDEQLMNFLERYLLELIEPVNYHVGQEQLLHDMGKYQHLLETYHLLKYDPSAFKQSMDWFQELFSDQLETIRQWPKQFILSFFSVIKEDDTFYFMDERDQQKYLIKNFKTLNLKGLAAKQLRVLALIVPIGENYISTPPIVSEPDQIILGALRKESAEEAAKDSILWYTSFLHDQIGEDIDDVFERLEQNLGEELGEHPDWVEEADKEDPPFYPAQKQPLETPEGFARRLLAQDETLNEFIYSEQMTAFLAQVIERFPQMFFAKSNAFSLLEAVRDIFTDEEVDDEQFEMYSNFASIFWYGFLRENMSDEIKNIEQYQVSKDYWYEKFVSY